MRKAPNHAPALVADLGRLVADGRASCEEDDRIAYARDLWPRQQLRTRAGDPAIAPPACVVWPSSTEEVARIVGFAAERWLPVVPYGAGSGVCGGVLPTEETIVIDMKRMRALLRLDRQRLVADAQAGILGQHLEDALDAQGFTLGHFPSSIYCSTLGGWLAARSAGQCSGRYGKIEDMARALTFVDGRGEIHRGTIDGVERAILPLVIGSEGILGIITEASLRIAPRPSRRFASFLFPRTEAGLDAIRAIYQAGMRPAVTRLYDPFDSMLARHGGLRHKGAKAPKERPRSGSARPGLGLRALTRTLRVPGALNALIDATPDERMGGAKLVLVWESNDRIAAAELEEAKALCLGLGAEDTGEEPARHWLAHRHNVSYRQSPIYAAGAFVDTMEVASTWSRLFPMYRAVREALSPHVFVMAHFSHAYPDGASIYFTFAGAARDDGEAMRVYDDAWRDALAAVIGVGGTLSHHHGVGRSKAPAMREEQGAAVDVVWALKRSLDPAQILNPGALVPEDGSRPVAVDHAVPVGDPTRALLDELRLELPNELDETGPDPLLVASGTRSVAIALRVARKLGAKIRPPGGVPRAGALRLDLRRMDEVLAIDAVSRLVHVRAGVSFAALERALAGHALGLGVEPVAELDVGTWLALGAPGSPSHDDDPIAQVVAGLEIVLPDGREVQLRPAPRRAVGPDLVGAIVGARGALGVIVGAHLVVRPRGPSSTWAYLFPTETAAEEALAWARGQAVRPASSSIIRVPDGAALGIVLDVEGARLRVALEILDEIARSRGGAPCSSEVAFCRTHHEPMPFGAVLEGLARELDPSGVLSP